MRLCGVTPEEVMEIVSPENRAGENPDGNLIFMGSAGKLSVCVILALDDLATVITVYDLET
jgi:hypothetical protein